MKKKQLIENIKNKSSYLCVGLDTDITKIPQHLLSAENPVLAFNKAIIDATKAYCVSYKINTAFYEPLGAKGWDIMAETVEYIGKDFFIIADAKRGDIGNTSEQYAKAFLQNMNFDAITIAPYMGKDSVAPFLQFEDKWGIVLGLTSNKGAEDFELLPSQGQLLYEKVLTTVATWGTPDNLMFVIGATQASQFENIRKLTPHHFYLVPGVGAQGGSLKDISKYAMNDDIGLLINVSRGIIYQSGDVDFAEKAAQEAKKYRDEMKHYIDNYKKRN